MRTLVALFAILTLTACSVSADAGRSPAVTATPATLPAIPAGGMLYQSLPAAKATERAPELVLNNWIVDAQIGAPVQADVYIVESDEYREPLADERVLTGSERYELTLSHPLDGWLIVKAPGYETWFIRLQYHIRSSRELSGPVELAPLGLTSLTSHQRFYHRFVYVSAVRGLTATMITLSLFT